MNELKKQFVECSVACRICLTQSMGFRFPAREMMYGTRETFGYEQCGECGSLQIATIPSDLERHYPRDYYSQTPIEQPNAKTGLAGWLVRQYTAATVFRAKTVGASVMKRLLPLPTDLVQIKAYLADSNLVSHGDAILDVGCGASPSRLAAMRRCGFTNVVGIDPFVVSDLNYHGVPVQKKTLDQVTGEFALVMFHHSLEHVGDPDAALTAAAKILRPGGVCLLRLPVAGTFFWRRFGPNWVELDAPRHLHIPSLQGVGSLALRSGFSVRKTFFDSEHWELLESKKYERNVAQREPIPTELDLTQADLAAERNWVEQLNRLGDAGRACFILEKRS